jgi:hypothetical protein
MVNNKVHWPMTVGTDKVRIQSKVKHASDMLNQLVIGYPENLLQYQDTDPDRETGVTILIPWRNAQSLWIIGLILIVYKV